LLAAALLAFPIPKTAVTSIRVSKIRILISIILDRTSANDDPRQVMDHPRVQDGMTFSVTISVAVRSVNVESHPTLLALACCKRTRLAERILQIGNVAIGA
jgi:hypothetical protein